MARYWRAWEMRWPFRELVNGGQPWDFLSFGSSCFAALLSDVWEGEEEERGKISKCMALVS